MASTIGITATNEEKPAGKNGLWKQYCYLSSILKETPKNSELYEMASERKNAIVEKLIKIIRAQPQRKIRESEGEIEKIIMICRVNSRAEIAFSEEGKMWMCNALGEEYCENYGGCRYSEPCGGCAEFPRDN